MLYASDYPYGRQPSSLLIALRTARAAGFDDDQVREMLAGTRTGSPTASRRRSRPSRPATATFTQPMTMARIHQYLSMATPLLWMRQPDSIGVIGLALNAADERDGYAGEELDDDPRAADHGARPLAELPEVEDEDLNEVSRASPAGSFTSPTSWR